MKRKFILFAVIGMMFSACADYQDDIDGLNKKYDELQKEQERQAELLATYQLLLQAMESRLTVSDIVTTDEGYKIVFSDGTELVVKNGSSVVRIVDTGDSILFYMSDGSVITMGKTVTLGLFALSEGGFGAGNGELVYFDYNQTTGSFVRNDNKRFKNIGETPNDLLLYGSKMYCTITGTSTDGGVLRVINPTTGETIGDVTVMRDEVKQQPRRLAAADGYVYVSLYGGGVARVDTLSFDYKAIALGGTFSEGMCVYGSSLYVCNSGQGTGNTVSVVDKATFTEIKTIEVPYNPTNIINVGTDELFLNTASVWSGPSAGALPNIHLLNAKSEKITKTFDIAAENMVAGKHYVYGTATDWNTFGGMLKKISIADNTVTDFTDDEDELMLAYKLSVNPLNGEVFLTQQMGQDIRRFKEDGTYIETLKAGQQNGAAIAFVNGVR
ncbi:MAG: hypothetical protein LBM62_06525 [Mediterranea sp.]|jgi:YVTN family beta-propeller protein|nr:hypothetical protein [Mediterranea sp.]